MSASMEALLARLCPSVRERVRERIEEKRAMLKAREEKCTQ